MSNSTKGTDTVHPSQFESGLDKREYMATAIYAGLVAACSTTKQRVDSAEHAVELADELIKALNKEDKS